MVGPSMFGGRCAPAKIGAPLPADVVQLVIAAREAWQEHGSSGDALDKALEPFSSRVPYEDQPDDEGPCTDCEDTGITIQTERRCACQPVDPRDWQPSNDDHLEGMDHGADFCIRNLAEQLGVKDWEQGDGTETWDGDASLTITHILQEAKILNEDLELADLGGNSELPAMVQALRDMVDAFGWQSPNANPAVTAAVVSARAILARIDAEQA